MLVNEVAKIYAGALFELSVEKNIIDQIEEEFSLFNEVLTESSDFMNFLDSPVISKEAKKNFMDRIFMDKFCDEIVGFLKVLLDNERQSALTDIQRSLTKLIDQHRNRQRVRVISSVKLDGSVLESIKSTLTEKLSKEIIIEDSVREEILGGFIIEIDDTKIDGSVASGLRSMRERLLKSKVVAG